MAYKQIAESVTPVLECDARDPAENSGCYRCTFDPEPRGWWIVKVVTASDEAGYPRKQFEIYPLNPSRERLAAADPRKRHLCSYHCASLMLAEFMNEHR